MSPKAPFAALCSDLRAAVTREGRSRLNAFSIEGTRLFERALRAECEIERTLVAMSYGTNERERAVLEALQQAGNEVQPVPDNVVREFTKDRTFGAVLGLVRQHTHDELPASGDLMVAVDVSDPGNTGALVRTAALSGASGFVAIGESDPHHPKAVRTSMGSIFRLPSSRRDDALQTIEELKGNEIVTIAAVASAGVPLWEAKPNPAKRHAILIGSEARGLDEAVAGACDAAWTVPQRDDLDSYSVNAAAAVLFYELARRHSDGP